jgi:hypothetical protein
MYVDFVTYYVGAVVGLRHFEKHKCHKLYREYVTISDEAFAILTLENNWDRWMAMAAAEEWTTAPVPTKWTVTRDRTASAAKKARTREAETGNPQARRYRGWSAQGINRYNQLYDEIEAERKSSRAATFEANLLRHFQRVEADSSAKKRKGVPKVAPPMPMPRHGLWSNDTIISSKRVKNKVGNRVCDERNDESDEDREEEEFGLPNYSHPEGMNHTSI